MELNNLLRQNNKILFVESKYHIEGELSSNGTIGFSSAKEIVFSLHILANTNLIIEVGSDFSKIEGNIIVEEGSTVVFVTTAFARLDESINITVDLKGINASCNFFLAAMSQETEKKIFDIKVNHLAPSTTSFVSSYGVCLDLSTLKILGTTSIKKYMKKSNAKQIGKIIVFDNNSTSSVSPQLLIDENDVIASHGATLGKVSDEHLFYLMSRGISSRNAKNLITIGHLLPVANRFTFDELKKSSLLTIESKVN